MAGLTLNPGEKDPRRIADVVRQLIEGRNNAVGTVTLTPSAAVTTVKAPNCAPGSLPFLFPMTANAAAAVTTTYVPAASVTKGQFIISHASNAQTDRAFGWVVLG